MPIAARALSFARNPELHLTTHRYSVVLDKTCSVRNFRTFREAERWARRQVANGLWDYHGSVAITLDQHTVALVNPDAYGRIWTDLRDAIPSLIKEIGL